MVNNKRTILSRKLRRDQTRPEEKFWANVRNRHLGGYKFKRQVPIGNFVADFACESAKIVVELDGSHHADQIEADQKRTQELERFGYRVIRIWNHEIIDNLDCALDHLLHELESRTH